MSDRTFLRLVVVALLVGAVLRFSVLDRNGLWLDELFTARAIGREGWSGLADEVARDVHPPGYFALVRVWSWVAGTSDIALRIPSVLAGLATIAFSAVLARRLSGSLAGVLAAFLVATAPFAVMLDREARGNALLAALAMAGFVLVGRRSYVPVAVALPWVHVFGGFALVAHGIWAVSTGTARAWSRAIVVTAICFAPWVFTLREQALTYASKPWYDVPPADALAWLWLALSSGSVSVAVVLLLGVCLATGRSLWLLAAGVVSLVLLPQAVSWLVAPVLRDRNVYPLLPVLCVVAACGFATLRPVVAGLGVLLGAFVSVRAVFYDPRGEQWREAAAVIREGFVAGDVVIANQPNLWRHYLGDIAPRALEELPEEKGRLWIAQAHGIVELPVEGLVLVERAFRGAHVRLVDQSLHPVRIGEEFSAPVRDAEGLHFYWSSSTRSAPVAMSGSCRAGLWGRSETAGGEPAKIAVRVIGAGTSVVSLPETEGVVYGEPFAASGEYPVEIEFVNDGVGADGGDRNAHVRAVFWGCG